MNKIMRWFRWRYRKIIHQTLAGRNRNRRKPELGRITKKDIDLITEEFEKNYKILKDDAPVERTLGSRFMLKNGMLSLALYRAIRKITDEEGYAAELCADILYKFFKKQVRMQRFAARLLNRDPQKQMNMLQRMVLKFPLASPGYICKIIKMDNVSAYDIFRCPVYDYFKSFGREEMEFFRYSWCTFDFAISEYMVRGGGYERNLTLSNGDDRCDMRWKAGG